LALALGLASGWWLAFVPVELALGFGYFTMHTVLQARASELLPEARSTAVSIFALMLFLGQSLGTLTAGLMIFRFGYEASFALGAGFVVLLSLWLFRIVRRSPQPSFAPPMGADEL
jgi:predicted MFS family arabinose efflux permease